LLGLSLLDGQYPREQLLQHVPTVVAIMLLGVCVWKEWLTATSLTCVVAFLWLHILGARYIYSYVPYDDWATTLAGTSVSEWFDWQRNHYDRLVHFSFGALCIVPAFEMATRYGKLPPRWAVLFALLAVTTIGSLYEVFEWLLTVVMSPGDAEAYNGQQGDYFDAQKDMALAFVGSLVAMPFVALAFGQMGTRFSSSRTL
jgi:putative membrane protein